MPNVDNVLRNLEQLGRNDRVDVVRSVLRGEQPHRVSSPVKVRANSKKKTAPNGDKYHVRIIGSTGGVARDGGVVPVTAWENGGLTNFEANPVIQFGHDYKQPPIGKSVYNELRHTDRALMQWWLFHEEDEMSRLMKRLYERGFMRAASVGFIVHEVHFPTEQEAEAIQKELGTREPIWWVAKRAELLETSAVPVPADPGALSTLQHAITNGRAYGLEVGPLEALRELCNAGDQQACGRMTMPDTNVETPKVETPASETRTAEQVAADAAEAQAKVIRDAVTAALGGDTVRNAVAEALKPLEERLAALEAARAEDEDELDEEDVADLDGEDKDDLEDGERGEEPDEPTVEVEVREGETLDQALDRIADEQIAKLRGAPQRRNNS